MKNAFSANLPRQAHRATVATLASPRVEHDAPVEVVEVKPKVEAEPVKAELEALTHREWLDVIDELEVQIRSALAQRARPSAPRPPSPPAKAKSAPTHGERPMTHGERAKKQLLEAIAGIEMVWANGKPPRA